MIGPQSGDASAGVAEVTNAMLVIPIPVSVVAEIALLTLLCFECLPIPKRLPDQTLRVSDEKHKKALNLGKGNPKIKGFSVKRFREQ